MLRRASSRLAAAAAQAELALPSMGSTRQFAAGPWGEGRGSPDGPSGDGNNTGRPATPWVRTVISGVDLLRNPKYNKGMAFTPEERDRLYLRGLLPPAQMSQSLQVQRVMTNLAALSTPLEKYSFLVGLQERNERLFYRVLMDYPEELKPIIYRPTVGQACLKYGLLFRRPRGLFISMADRGRIYPMLKNWPERDVKLIVLTDGERVLGLGDLGIQGMGIAVSKVQAYTAYGGLDPSLTLPVCIDAGTDTETLLEDPFYIGLRHKRVRGDSYDELVDEFVSAAQRRFGQTVLFQFEDFGNANGLRLLEQYRGRAAVFNDDIQGTAAAMLGGLIASLPIIGGTLADHTYLFAGAGEAGCGMADLLALAIAKVKKIPLPVARQRIWLVDSKGLITRSRMNELADHKLPWAHEGPEGCTNMLAAVKAIRPSCLIGVRRSFNKGSSIKIFTEEVVREMAAINKRPLIFALSRPVANSECTAEEAYKWSDYRAVYSSGCVQPSVTAPDGQELSPLPSTSAYVFPGIGLGAAFCGAERLRDETFLAVAEALAAQVTDADRKKGSVYPQFKDIRAISVAVANAVAKAANEQGMSTRRWTRDGPGGRDLGAAIRGFMWDPFYRVFG